MQPGDCSIPLSTSYSRVWRRLTPVWLSRNLPLSRVPIAIALGPDSTRRDRPGPSMDFRTLCLRDNRLLVGRKEKTIEQDMAGKSARVRGLAQQARKNPVEAERDYPQLKQRRGSARPFPGRHWSTASPLPAQRRQHEGTSDLIQQGSNGRAAKDNRNTTL